MNSRSHRAWWSGVFAVNLIVPVLLAWMFVAGMAWIGVFLAAAAYWRAGMYVCRNHPRIARSLIIGGGLVGLSQLCPILQIFAGSLALCVSSPREEYFPLASKIGVFGGFLATAITGGILLAVATIVGLPLVLACQPRPVVGEQKPLGKLPLFDEELDG